MKINLYTIIASLVLSTFSFAQNGQKNFIDQPYIEVTGQVETEIIPNEIYLRIVLNENDKKGKISIEKQENMMLATLKTLHLNLDENLSILDFNGFYKKKFLAANEVTKKKIYQLMVNDGKMLGEVYRALDAIDISNISIIKVNHSKIEEYKKEAKIKALKDAKLKAENYANAINQVIGKALFIQESSNEYQVAYMLSGKASGVSSKRYVQEEVINNLDIKKIVISETILARFSLN